MKRLGIAVALTVLAAGGASAQSINIGPGGIGVDVDGPRRVDRIERRVIREVEPEDRVVVRRRVRDIESTGSTRCRTTIVRRENRFGELVTRRIRECD